MTTQTARTPEIDEQLEILRRIGERGRNFALSRDRLLHDTFQHMLDEVTRLRGMLELALECFCVHPRSLDSVCKCHCHKKESPSGG